MVLRRSAIALACAAAGLAVACMPKPQPVQARAPLAVAVAAVRDRVDATGVDALEEASEAPLLAALGARNLRPKSFSRPMAESYRNRRTTAHRLTALAEAAPEAELVALVETQVRFYSQLSGRYRWTVDARLTLTRRDAKDEATTVEIDVPVFLDFDHERENEALAVAAPRIAQELGALADDFLGGVGVVGSLPGPRYASARTAPGSLAAKKGRPRAESIYFVMIDRFANGDPSNDGAVDPADPQAFHGGDLRGLLDELDHLDDLGVSTVWISPVFAMRTEKFHGHGAYHGYWTTDFGKVEPRFGDEKLLKDLSDALHARGMKLMLDIVLNHVAPDAPLTKEKPEWFHGKGAITDWNDPEQLQTHDVFGLPDLAQEREDVYAFLLKHSLSWIDRVSPDGFRLDAARHVPMEFWARFNADVKRYSKGRVTLLGEMYDGDAITLQRTLAKGGFDAVFDFPLYFAMTDVFCKDRPPARLASTLSLDRLYDDPSRLVTFLDNHDLPRVLSACGGDTTKVANALAFQLTARGVPSFTYGIESGLTGAKEPENRGGMRFDAGHPLKKTLRSLLALRAEHPVFARGASRPVHLDGSVFAYARVDDREAALIAVNSGDEPASVRVPAWLAGPARDALTGAPIDGDAVVVPARGVRVALLAPRSRTVAAATPRVVPTGFAIGGAPAADGEKVLVVGSGPELGSWNPAQGKALRRTATGSFVGEVPLASGVYEWKLVVRASDGTYRWETGENRALLVEAPGEVTARWR